MAALPLVAIGIALGVVTANLSKHKTKKGQDPAAETYIGEGVALGLCVGVALGSSLGNLPMGMCFGMSIGMVVGVCNTKPPKDGKGGKNTAQKPAPQPAKPTNKPKKKKKK